ncbi:TadE-like protein [Caballeronia hypogeia]|uniref:TadE-like protein n=1 Tax=Caballeronia hypogeia TaxID=1777140 RepID=A0A158C916_9BURK|nr:TadE/TadG family type IV pilus assembly protein [Caballeronia hypogeia]SAK78848.1 TadE-like protein [Caballeronia hypogeia]
MMKRSTKGTTRRSFLGRLARSESGVSAIEFSLIVPMMLLLMLGFTELYLYMRAKSLVEHTAFTLADSIGQMTQVINDQSSVTQANSLASIWAAAIQLGTPNDLRKYGGVIVTSICETNSTCNGLVYPNSTQAQWRLTGTPKVLWSKAPVWQPSGMATNISTTNPLPTGWPFRQGDSAIAVEVFYTYTPFSMTAPFWHNAPGAVTFHMRVFVRPRNGQALNLVSPST